MSILDRIVSKKQHVVQEATFSLADKARLLIGELVKDLDRPNQAIINDLILLIETLSNNPDPSLNVAQLTQTAHLLIQQLVKPISNPNQQIIEELITLIAASGNTGSKINTTPIKAEPPKADPKKTASANEIEQLIQAKAQKTNATQQQTPVQTTPQPQQAVQSQTVQQSTTTSPVAAKVQSATPSVSAPIASEDNNKHLVNLIMDQTKEIVRVTSALNNRLKDLEDKMNNKFTSHQDTITEVKNKLDTYDKSLEDIQKAMDKFIGLYEIITNQFNPFVTHAQVASPSQKNIEQQAPAVQQTTPPAPTQVSQAVKQETSKQADPPKTQPNTSSPVEHHDEQAQETVENLPESIEEMVKFVKQASDQDYNLLYQGDINHLALWGKTIARSSEIESFFTKKPSKSEAVKFLMKILLREKVAKQKEK